MRPAGETAEVTRKRDDAELAVGLPADGESLGTVRRCTLAACEDWGLSGATCEVIALVASELVGNVVRHAGGVFHLRIRKQPSLVVIEVEDLLDCPPPVATDPGPDAESGRGLLVVEKLARRWGCDQLPHGKRIWAQIAA